VAYFHIARFLIATVLLYGAWHNAHWSVAALLTWIVLWQETNAWYLRETAQSLAKLLIGGRR
jgi:hypothetical protein